MKKRRSSFGNVTPMFPGSAPEPPPAETAWKGSFRPGGSYREDGPGTDALTLAVLEMARQRAKYAPAQLAAVIRASAAMPAFHEETLEQWDTLRFEDWWQARAQGAAEAFVKYEGCAVEGTWAGGRHVPREKVQWEPAIPDHVRAEMNHELLESIDRLVARRSPDVGDAEPVQARSFLPPAEIERRRRAQLSEYERITGIGPVVPQDFEPALDE